MKKCLAVVVAATVGAALATDYYVKPGATDLSVASSYTSDAAGTTTCTTTPGANDWIYLPAAVRCAVDAPSASFATLAGCARIIPQKGSVLEITVAEGRSRLTAPYYAAAEDSEKRTWGTLVKKGAGELVLGPAETVTSSRTGAAYLYAVNADVVEGTLRYPEDILVNESVGNLKVSNGATVFMPKSPNTASQIYFNHIYAAPGSLLTNDTQRGATTGHVIGVTPYPGFATNEDSRIAGAIAGGIRIWTSGNIDLSGAQNTLLTATTVSGGGGKPHVSGGSGVLSAESFASFGAKTLMVYTGGGFRYLGRGETTQLPIQLYMTSNPGYVDAGAYGNLVFGGKLSSESDSDDKTVVKRFRFQGSNVVESVWTGDCTVLTRSNTDYPLHIAKGGTGVWRFADSSTRNHIGGTSVLNGTLRFDSIAEQGQMCSFGPATRLTADDHAAVKNGKFVSYALTLGGTDVDDKTTGDPVLEFSGTNSAATCTRPMVLAGRGGHLRNDSDRARLVFYGISARDAGQNPTLVLDGSGTAENVAGDITNGLGTVSVTKRGSGRWRLSGDLSFSGDLKVEEGTLEVEKPSSQYTWFRYTVCQLGDGNYSQSRTRLQMRELALYDQTGMRQNLALKFVTDDPYLAGRKAAAFDGSLDLKPGEMSYARCPDAKRTLPVYTRQPAELPQSPVDVDLDGYVSGYGKTTNYKPHRYNILFDQPPRVTDPSTWIPVVMRLTNGVPAITHFDLQTMSNYSTSSQWPKHVIWEGSPDGVHWDVIFDNRDTADGFGLSRTYVNEKGELCGLGASMDKYTSYVCNLWMSDMMPFNASTDNTARTLTATRCYAFSATGNGRTYDTLGKVASVSVAKGATLKAVGGEVVLKSLSTDAKEAGTIDGFAFAPTGTIDVTGAGDEGDIELPGTFANCTDLDNAANWTVKLDGTVRTGRFIVCKGGKLHLVKRGLMLIVR